MLTSVLVILASSLAAMTQVGSAGADSAPSAGSSTRMDSPPAGITLSRDQMDSRETDAQVEITHMIDTGGISRERGERARSELANIIVQTQELRMRDGGLNETDKNFLQQRIDRLFASLQTSTPVLSDPKEPVQGPALTSIDEVPTALTCDGKRALLSIGKDRAIASVQRYGSANIALIVEAVARPYQSTDSMALSLTGEGINMKIDGARAGAYLVASTTANIYLKSKHTARVVARISEGAATPQFVKIWGSCMRK